jgi:hypothetical protein
VGDLVADLTDVSKPGDGNRALRKAIVTYDWPQIARLARHIEGRLRQHGGS